MSSTSTELCREMRQNSGVQLYKAAKQDRVSKMGENVQNKEWNIIQSDVDLARGVNIFLALFDAFDPSSTVLNPVLCLAA